MNTLLVLDEITAALSTIEPVVGSCCTTAAVADTIGLIVVLKRLSLNFPGNRII